MNTMASHYRISFGEPCRLDMLSRLVYAGMLPSHEVRGVSPQTTEVSAGVDHFREEFHNPGTSSCLGQEVRGGCDE
jgi:hypothetical protein